VPPATLYAEMVPTSEAKLKSIFRDRRRAAGRIAGYSDRAPSLCPAGSTAPWSQIVHVLVIHSEPEIAENCREGDLNEAAAAADAHACS
jgi:hypothetical protein